MNQLLAAFLLALAISCAALWRIGQIQAQPQVERGKTDTLVRDYCDMIEKLRLIKEKESAK